MRASAKNLAWVDVSIFTGAGFFVFALFLATVFDPTIRVLHALQAVIYIAVILLTRRQSAWGFGAGLFIAAVWTYANLFHTNFIELGFDQFRLLLLSGRIPRPDLFVGAIAAIGHCLMIAACLAGFLGSRPGLKDWGKFLTGGVVAVTYFALIITAAGPQYLDLLRRVLHL